MTAVDLSTTTTSTSPPCILKVHARWYPIGPRFLVRCGFGGEHMDLVPVLTPNGWVRLPDFMREMKTADWPISSLAMTFGESRTGAVYEALTPVGYALLRGVIDRAMVEPRLWEGVQYEEHVLEDIRVGWKAPPNEGDV